MSNARTFGIKLDKAFDKILDDQFLPFKQKIAMEALTRVTFKMPVDTGRARGNTIVSLGSMNSEVSEAIDISGSSAISKGASLVFSDRDPFGLVFIQNNLPYIGRLEDGYSGQAPLGMFAVTAQELEVMFQ